MLYKNINIIKYRLFLSVYKLQIIPPLEKDSWKIQHFESS